MANTIPSENILAAEAIRLLPFNTVLRNWVNTNYDGTIKKQGDTVTVETFPKLILSTPADPNGAIAAQDLTITTEVITADQTRSGRVQLGDLEASIGNLNFEKEVGASMAEAMAEVYEEAIAAHYTDAHIDNQIATVALTAANVHGAFTSLKQALSEKNCHKNIAVFIAPDVTKLLLDAGLASGTEMGYKEGLNGYVAQIAGMKIFETNKAPAGFMLAFQKGAIHLADKLTKTKIKDGTDGFYSNLMIQMTYGTEVFDVNSEKIATHAYTI